MAKAIALFSGGLDSQLAVKLMLDQGIEVQCLTSRSVFHQHRSHEGKEYPAVAAAERLGVPITVLNTDDEMLELVKHPKHGVGKNMNPCVDCRIFLLRKASEKVRENGADFIVTGEVLGQRPMSQRKYAMALIEREAGVEGRVVRPLCAKLLEPTIPEKDRLVDREKLLAIRGRSRKEQMALAEKLGITEYPSPAGGCLLTDPGFSRRLAELMEHCDPDVNDTELLKLGRHFRLDDRTKAVVGRDEGENCEIEGLAREGDLLLDAADVMGPTTLLRGEASESNVAIAARLTVKYGKARNEASARVTVRHATTDESSILTAPPAADERVAELMITRQADAG